MSIIGLFFAGTLALLFVSAAVAPLESLGWYAGWFGEKEEEEPQELLTPDPAGEISPASHYLVYLSGIGAIAPNSIPSEELPFIAGLQQKLPDSLVLTDVFPYSVTNLGLTGQRVTARVWRWIEQLRLKNPMAVAAFLINLRNVFQVATSADSRYGPIYNLGVAQEIRNSLVRHGYPLDNGTPVTLLGWSGGGQIALGAAWYLPGLIGGPVYVLSLGGVMFDDIGLNVERLWHPVGEKTRSPPGESACMPDAGRSSRRRRGIAPLVEGKIVLIPLGPFTHNGKGNYLTTRRRCPVGRRTWNLCWRRSRRRWPRRTITWVFGAGCLTRAAKPRCAPQQTLRAQALRE